MNQQDARTQLIAGNIDAILADLLPDESVSITVPVTVPGMDSPTGSYFRFGTLVASTLHADTGDDMPVSGMNAVSFESAGKASHCLAQLVEGTLSTIEMGRQVGVPFGEPIVTRTGEPVAYEDSEADNSDLDTLAQMFNSGAYSV